MCTHGRKELVAVANLRAGIRLFLARSDRITRSHGLSSRHYELLAMLHAAEDASTATELAGLLQLSRNATSELIDRAEQAGLVRRVSLTGDRRRKGVVATTEGSRAFLAAFRDLATERKRFVAILEDVARNLGADLVALGRLEQLVEQRYEHEPEHGEADHDPAEDASRSGLRLLVRLCATFGGVAEHVEDASLALGRARVRLGDDHGLRFRRLGSNRLGSRAGLIPPFEVEDARPAPALRALTASSALRVPHAGHVHVSATVRVYVGATTTTRRR